MSTDAIMEIIEHSLHIQEVAGSLPYSPIVALSPPIGTAREMTDADWDKFEADIREAFEQVTDEID